MCGSPIWAPALPLPHWWPVENEGKHALSCQRPRSHTRNSTTTLPAQDASSSPHVLAREQKQVNPWGFFLLYQSLHALSTCLSHLPKPCEWMSVRSTSVGFAQEDHLPPGLLAFVWPLRRTVTSFLIVALSSLRRPATMPVGRRGEGRGLPGTVSNLGDGSPPGKPSDEAVWSQPLPTEPWLNACSFRLRGVGCFVVRQ